MVQIPGDLATPDLVKSLNNRSRVYVKLDKMELAEADASEVCLCDGMTCLLFLV